MCGTVSSLLLVLLLVSHHFMNRAGYLCYLCQARTASPPPAGECGYIHVGGSRGAVHRVSSSPRLSSEGGQLLSPGVREGLNWLGWLPYEHRRRESCKFSSFPARTRVPASAGGGQKLLLSHSCPRPCGEMRRVLTLRTQDPASLVIKTI